METNKELIAQLREYASNSGYSHTDYADTMRDAAAVLAEQDDAAPEQRWIDADISKPAQSQAVLVDSTWGVRLAYRHEPSWAKGCFQDAISRSDEGMTDFDGHCKGVFKVKRWMPLPSATLPTAAPVALSDAQIDDAIFASGVARLYAYVDAPSDYRAAIRAILAAATQPTDADKRDAERWRTYRVSAAASMSGLHSEALDDAVDRLNAAIAASAKEAR